MTTSTTTADVRSADGTLITLEVQGNGPAIIVIPGGARAAHHYRDLGAELAADYTVYAVNRRGRFGSGPHGSQYSIETECDDIAAVQEFARADLVFGHSYGGLVALEYARRHEVGALAVYEPAVSINGSVPVDWLPEFDRAYSRGRYARAMAIVAKRLQVGGPLNSLPVGISALLMRPFLRGEAAAELPELLKTIPHDVREGGRLSSSGERYRDINSRTLLLRGERSPAYLKDACTLLAQLVPAAQLVTFPRLAHNGPDAEAPSVVAAELRRFFS
jgi:pimeloyl-ACP methyl ester carboxylesterase